jgi:CRISPR system Cascade subunit CasE
MYLTHIQLDLNHSLARADLADPYQMHSTLARLMSPNDTQAPANFLWRCEAMGQHNFSVLLQSHGAPFPERLESKHQGWAKTIRTKQFDVIEFLSRSERFQFRLRANPSVCRAGKRHGLHREEEQLAWLNRQGERGGFGVEFASVSQAQRSVGHRRKGAQSVVLFDVLFDGVLLKTDASSLLATIENGIGRGKHMGLGLLSLAVLPA